MNPYRVETAPVPSELLSAASRCVPELSPFFTWSTEMQHEFLCVLAEQLCALGVIAPRPSSWMREQVEWRATFLGVFVGRTPTVRLRAQGHEFTLDVGERFADALSQGELRREVDIVASVVRDSNGNVVGGYLLGFHELSFENSVDVWREWYGAQSSRMRSP